MIGRKKTRTLYRELQWWLNMQLLQHLCELDVEIVFVEHIDGLWAACECERAGNAW